MVEEPRGTDTTAVGVPTDHPEAGRPPMHVTRRAMRSNLYAGLLAASEDPDEHS